MKTEVTTKTGFTCEIDENALDDMELLDFLMSVDDGDISKLPKAMDKLLGKDNKQRLYDHLRNDGGRVPTEAFAAELTDIFNGLQSKKK